MSTLTGQSSSEPLARCAAQLNDGECSHPQCPQRRDGEPEKSGRSCPLPWVEDL